ncbi:MAG TPA: lysine--tRNA ligase, partial [Blastocatellia bacterium]|nr:lysine--tRNA ligase [Blastocatellia bacterium]
MDEEQQPIPDENDQIEQRRRSLAEIIQLGFDAYPHKFERTHSINQLVQQFSNQTSEELDVEKPRAKVAGRVHAINKMGKAAFIRFTDGAELLQIYIKSNEV